MLYCVYYDDYSLVIDWGEVQFSSVLSFHFFYDKGFQTYSFHQGGYEAAFSLLF